MKKKQKEQRFDKYIIVMGEKESKKQRSRRSATKSKRGSLR